MNFKVAIRPSRAIDEAQEGRFPARDLLAYCQGAAMAEEKNVTL